MRIHLVLAAGLVLAGCEGGGSLGRLNPFTWFGGGTAQTVTTLAPRRGYPQAVDTRPRIGRILSASLERTPEGLIIRATGEAPAGGWHNADLVRVPSSTPGVAQFEFRAQPPSQAVPAVTARQRQITAATFLLNRYAAGIRQVRITAATNSRTLRR